MTNTNKNLLPSQDVKWVHPINVCIEGNRIMKNNLTSSSNAAAFSLQYLNHGDNGAIEFEVPGLDNQGNPTNDWTQGFFVGFSDGAIEPDYEKNIVGVRFQHLNPDQHPNVVAFRVIMGDNLMHEIHWGTRAEAGDKLVLLIEDSILKIKVKGEEKVICKRLNKKPMVAKIAFYFSGKKVVSNVKLLGDWKTNTDCTEAPYQI